MDYKNINLKDLKSTPMNEASQEIVVVEEVEEIAEQVESISPEEREKIDKIKSNINMMDSRLSLEYGVGAQRELSTFSDTVLGNIRNKDNESVGDLLVDLMGEIQGLEIEDIEEKKGIFSNLPFVKSVENKLNKVMQNYDTVEVQIGKIEAQLDRARTSLIKDVTLFDELFDRNIEYFKELQLYIVAGEEAIAETRNEVIPRLREEAIASGDQMDAQLVKDFEDTVNRFEKKVHDLKLTKTMAIQTAPQIRLIQNNDKLLVDKIQVAILNTIPLWKSQIVMAIGLNRQEKALKMQREVSDTTNKLLRRNAELLKENTTGVLEESERGIIDLETLKEVNKNLIETIEDGIKIQEEGRKKRIVAEQELLQLEENLKNTLLKTMDDGNA